MPKVVFNGEVIAEAEQTPIVEGNYYFAQEHVKQEFLQDSANGTSTVCGWKGRAYYFDIDVHGHKVSDAAWYYPETKQAASVIQNRIAFYKHKVDIVD